jgi:hypothetical protein
LIEKNELPRGNGEGRSYFLWSWEGISPSPAVLFHISICDLSHITIGQSFFFIETMILLQKIGKGDRKPRQKKTREKVRNM